MSFIITEISEKKTASKSIIVKGIYEGQDVFGKFYINNDDITDFDDSLEEIDFSGIIYEQQIYKYIRKKTEEHPEISEHLIASIHDFENISLYDYIHEESLALQLMQLLERDFYEIIFRYKYIKTKRRYNMLFNGFLLIDTKMISLVKYLPQINQDNYIDIFFELLYSNLIMRNSLNIMHNDIHFGNIFIEQLDTPIEYKYTFLGIKKIKKFKVLLYDHDHNYSERIVDIIPENKYINGFLCDEYGSCNVYNNKDGYVLINNIYYYKDLLISKISKDKYIELFNIISSKDLTYPNTYRKYELIKRKGKTHAFCDWRLINVSSKYNIDKIHCGREEDNPELNINDILDRYIQNYQIELFDSVSVERLIISLMIHKSIYLCIIPEFKSKFRQSEFIDYFKYIEDIKKVVKKNSKIKNKYLKYKNKYLLLTNI